MTPNGFVRKCILIAVVTWFFLHFLLADGQIVHSLAVRSLGKIALIAIAVSGVITLLQQRISK